MPSLVVAVEALSCLVSPVSSQVETVGALSWPVSPISSHVVAVAAPSFISSQVDYHQLPSQPWRSQHEQQPLLHHGAMNEGSQRVEVFWLVNSSAAQCFWHWKYCLISRVWIMDYFQTYDALIKQCFLKTSSSCWTLLFYWNTLMREI